MQCNAMQCNAMQCNALIDMNQLSFSLDNLGQRGDFYYRSTQ